MHAKQTNAKAGKGGSAAAVKPSGFKDANAKWLTPKAAVAKPARGRSKQQVAAAPNSSPSGSDSDDKPLPGELSDGDGSLLLEESGSGGDLDDVSAMEGLSGSSDADNVPRSMASSDDDDGEHPL